MMTQEGEEYERIIIINYITTNDDAK